MQKRIFPMLFLAAFGCLCSSSCIFPTSSTTVKGFIKYDRKPVAGAKISFGGRLGETETTTDAKGFYTVTARHRPTQMLYLRVEKSGYARHEESFPGFAAPSGDKNIELMGEIPTIR